MHEKTQLDLRFKYLTCTTDKFVGKCQQSREGKYPQYVYLTVLGKTNRIKAFFLFSKSLRESFKVPSYCYHDCKTVTLAAWPMFFHKHVLSPCETVTRISSRFCLRGCVYTQARALAVKLVSDRFGTRGCCLD